VSCSASPSRFRVRISGCVCDWRTARLSSDRPVTPHHHRLLLKPLRRHPALLCSIKGRTYTVKRGDTLYSIALEKGFGLQGARGWNGLPDPSVGKRGRFFA